MSPDPRNELLRHQRFLERLALSLVADEDLAADLVQDASTAYLTHPPLEVGSSRAWLARVIRRLASRGRRSAVRRTDRERSVARGDCTDGGLPGVDAQLDAQARLIEMVRGLSAEQREVLIHRFARGQAPSRIAEELGISVQTVNTRLRRALASLRARLDRREGGDTRVWALALLPRLGEFKSSGAIAMSTVPALGGALAMMTVQKAGLGLVALGVGLFFLWPEERELVLVGLDSSASVASDAELIPSAATRTRTVVRSTPTDPIVLDRADGAQDPSGADTDPWSLEVIVEGVGVESRPTQVTVTGSLDPYAWPKEVAIRSIMDAPGSAVIDIASLIDLYDQRFARSSALTAVHVHLEHPDCADLSVRVDIVSNGEVDAVPENPLVARAKLEAGGVIIGRLAPAGIEALGEAQVVAYPMGSSGPDEVNAVARATVDETGAFRLRTPSVGSLALAAIAPEHRPETRLITIDRGTTHDLGVIAIERGLAIDGTLSVGGSAVGEGANVRLDHETRASSWRLGDVPWGFGRSMTWLDGRFEWAWYHTSTNESGAFRFDGLSPRAVLVECSKVPGRSTMTDGLEPIRVAPPATIELEFGGITLDVVLDFGEVSVQGGRYQLETPGRNARWRSIRTRILEDDHTIRWAIRGGVAVTVTVELDGFEQAQISFQTPETPGAHAQHILHLVPAKPPGLIRLHVEGETPTEGAIMQVVLTPITTVDNGSGRELARSAPFEGGHVLVADVPEGLYSVVAYPSEVLGFRRTTSVDGETTVDVRSMQTVEASCFLAQGGNVRFHARAPEGHLVSLACTMYDEDGTKMDTNFHTTMPNGRSYGGGWALTDRGPNHLRSNLPVGLYRVQLRHEEFQDFEEEVEILPGEITVRTFDLIAR